MYSRVVPSCSLTTAHRARTSSVVAARDGMGLPSPSLWVKDCDDENPSPPAASASWSRAVISASCPAVDSACEPASPIT